MKIIINSINKNKLIKFIDNFSIGKDMSQLSQYNDEKLFVYNLKINNGIKKSLFMELKTINVDFIFVEYYKNLISTSGVINNSYYSEEYETNYELFDSLKTLL